MGQPQKEFPSKEALALAEALKRGRNPQDSRPKATIEDICKALGAERIYTSKGNAKPGVTMFIKRPQD
jgi:hypothetical protein